MGRIERGLERSLSASGGRKAVLGLGTVGIGLALGLLYGLPPIAIVFLAVPILALYTTARLATRKLGRLDAAAFVLVFAVLATLVMGWLLKGYTTYMGGPDGFTPIVLEGRVTAIGWAWTLFEMTVAGSVLIALRILLGLRWASPPAPS